MTATLYIVRHGNTFEKGDLVTRVGGRTDLKLSASGEAQSEALAKHFAREGVVFASARSGPLKRTRRTAEVILAGQEDVRKEAPELAIDLFLREIDYGPDENKPEAEVVARIGQAALEDWERDFLPPPGWRVDPAAVVGNWEQVFGELRGTDGAHLIVTSNGIARFALLAAGASQADGRPDGPAGGKLATGAYGVIDLGPDGETVRGWNIRPPL
jgi:probable phosphoglycerate mutase